VDAVETIADLRAALARARAAGRTVGLVPTMGYLHEGHLSLAATAAARCDEVVVTVFVNPLQFAAGEDLDTYPRDPAGDAAKAASAGATLLFAPSEAEMYPQGRDAVATSVAVPSLASVMEGASRPEHFAGVCTVVAKIFNIVGPCTAFFGEKDYQQLRIVGQMAADLSFDVDVVGCPIVREPDGLAMSSRNVRLDPSRRAAAVVLHRALCRGAALADAGERDAGVVRGAMAAVVAAEPLADLDYVEVADPATLRPLGAITGPARLFGVVRLGPVRLIDNLAVGGGDAP